MEGMKYVNLIDVGVVVIEIRGVENGKFEECNISLTCNLVTL